MARGAIAWRFLLDTLDKPKLDNQRDVVLNERRQSYENQPYGMAELLLPPSAVAQGPPATHWPMIGSMDGPHGGQPSTT